MLGTDATVSKGGRGIKLIPQKVNKPDFLKQTGTTPGKIGAHMQNFFDCIRSGKETKCPFDVGFRVSIACRMAVDSYLKSKTLKWDAAKEGIVG